MKQNNAERIAAAARLIVDAQHFVAFTGAGISTSSGIPDFRSKDTGLWQRFDPMVVASLTAFQETPQVFYNWLRPLLIKTLDATPNPAHHALAKMEQLGILKSVITQNIDGLHQKAGVKKVIELHGSIQSYSCPNCRSGHINESMVTTRILNGNLPRCLNCSAVLRPTITLFEETLPMDAWNSAESESHLADVMLIAGSSLEVTPAGSLPYEAYQNGCKLIIVNLTPTYLDENAEFLFKENLAEFLPVLLDGIISKK